MGAKLDNVGLSAFGHQLGREWWHLIKSQMLYQLS